MRSVKIKRIVALTLALVMLALSLVSCASKGKPLLKLEGESISVNVFNFYLSRMKGILTSATSLGNDAKADAYWDSWYDMSTKTTLNTHYTNMVLESAKMYLAALALFEERKLELPKEKIAEIDARLEEMVTNEAEGSKTAFNAMIGEYGVNYEMLREAYIIEAKIECLEDDILGADSSKISEKIIDDYYKENYARYKHVFLKTYDYQYVLDENKDVVYVNEDGSIAYDTTKTKTVDKNGKTIYVYTDDNGKTRIAYDTSDPEKKQKATDSSGNLLPLIKYNSVEKGQIIDEAKEILSQAKAGDMLGFDQLIAKYNEDTDVDKYPKGFYVPKGANSRTPEVIEKVFSMEVNAVDWVESEYGIHVIMRCPLEDGAYASEEYKDLFISNNTGTYLFMDKLRAQLMTEYLEPYKAKVEVDEELLATVDIKRAGINRYY